MTVRYCVTIDTEEEWDWDSGWPTSIPAIENIRHLQTFQDVCSKYEAATTYFVNRAVLDSPVIDDVIRDFQDREHCEMGMHIHPWNTPPISNQAVTAEESFIANLPDDVANQKLQHVYDHLISAGITPTSFRGGRYSCGPNTQKFLRNNGFIADASPVPFTQWDSPGSPDFASRDGRPVRIDDNDLPPLWELPLTLGFTRNPQRLYAKLFQTIRQSPLRHLRLIGLAERLGIVRRVWLNFEDPMGDNMLPYLQQLRKERPFYVCFTLHSSSLLPGGNLYVPTNDDVQRLLKRTADSLSILQQWEDFQPATISQIAKDLEGQFA
ncbi:MAG: hypothetical protein ABJZ55_11250 [Fuerstiella sp.]